VLACLVLLDQPVEGDLRGGAVVEVRQPEVLEGEVGVGLRGDGADPGRRCRHGGPDGQELGGHGDAPRRTVVGPGHDREGHVPNIVAVRYELALCRRQVEWPGRVETHRYPERGVGPSI
jgi:hypothetical protein